jgi:hypothetical protein
MFAKLDQLKKNCKIREAQLKWLWLQSQRCKCNLFYLVQQQQQLAALDTTIVISNQDWFGTKSFYNWKASKLEVLNAQVDLNTDKVALRQIELYANTKTLLNQILARY